jgi:hypothetical protein
MNVLQQSELSQQLILKTLNREPTNVSIKFFSLLRLLLCLTDLSLITNNYALQTRLTSVHRQINDAQHNGFICNDTHCNDNQHNNKK